MDMSKTQKFFALTILYVVGTAAMSTSGYFLIDGMKGGAMPAIIISAIIMQLTETICFFSAAALAWKFWAWKIPLFGLGMVLFVFTIEFVNYSQQSAVTQNDAQIDSINNEINRLHGRLDGLDNLILGYKSKAEADKNSRYTGVRDKALISLREAERLENEKLKVSKFISDYESKKRLKMSDIFDSDSSGGLYIIKYRSYLIEFCGIIMFAFAAFLNRKTGNFIIKNNGVLFEKPYDNSTSYTQSSTSIELLPNQNSTPNSTDTELNVSNDAKKPTKYDRKYTENWAANLIGKLQYSHDTNHKSHDNKIKPRIPYKTYLKTLIKSYQEGEVNNDITVRKIKDIIIAKHKKEIGTNPARNLKTQFTQILKIGKQHI